MSYLLDRKIKRKKFLNIGLFVVGLFILFYFRIGIFNSLAYAGQKVFRPILIFGNNVGGKIGNTRSFFISKNSLYLENQNLKSQIDAINADRANYDSVMAENLSLKNILGRKNEKVDMILGAILSKPNQSLYDTLIIDAGTTQGIKTEETVFALGNVPIGRVDTVYASSSKVVLFSNSGEKTQALVSLGHSPTGEAGGDVFLELVGRGGGNFEIIMPRDFTLAKGDQVILPGINNYVLAVVETIISDPRDSFAKALLVSPVNIQEIKFVQIEKQK